VIRLKTMETLKYKASFAARTVVITGVFALLVGPYHVSANAPKVTTHPASSISETSAILNGFFDSNGGSATIKWFEYGETLSLTRSTVHIPYGVEFLNLKAGGLKKNTLYYFRGAAQNSDGLTYGLTYSFKTGPNPISNLNPVNNQPFGSGGLIPAPNPGNPPQGSVTPSPLLLPNRQPLLPLPARA